MIQTKVSFSLNLDMLLQYMTFLPVRFINITFTISTIPIRGSGLERLQTPCYTTVKGISYAEGYTRDKDKWKSFVI